MRRSGLKSRSVRTILPGVATLAALVTAACDGPNRFSGPVGIQEDLPRVEIVRPDTDETAIGVADALTVSVSVRDNVGIDSVVFYGVFLPTQTELELGTGAVVQKFGRRVVTELVNVRSDSLTRQLLPVDTTTKRTASVVVEAYDQEQNLGADTVRVQIGGPTVRLLDLSDGQRVRPGQTLGLRTLVQDPAGINYVEFILSGAVDSIIPRTFPLPVDSAIVTGSLVLPANPSVDYLEVSSRAVNVLDPPLSGRSEIARLILTQEAVLDTIPPRLALTVVEPEVGRVELGDSIEIQLSGSDPSGDGVVSSGFTVIATGAASGDTVVLSDSVVYAAADQGTVVEQFFLPILAVDSLSLPDTLTYEVTGFMWDEARNCGAATNEITSVRCDPSSPTVALDEAGYRFSFIVVAGRTVLLPDGGTILDAEVDTVPGSRRLFLSNVTLGQVEVFDLEGDGAFAPPIRVGSSPWGLAFNPGRDSLWVANSGSAGFSVIDLATEREADDQRLLTPDVVLHDISLNTTEGTFEATPRPTLEEQGFSDRPQYIGVDSYGNVIYSTVTTGAGELGTARKAYFLPGAEQAEVKLFVDYAVPPAQENQWALAHVDRIDDSNQSSVVIWDHVPGFPSQEISATVTPLNTPDAAVAQLRALGSDAAVWSGTWDVAGLGFQDTTYVASAGNGSWVAIGEGGTSGAARVMTYQASQGAAAGLSSARQVQDFLTNASEEVRGVAVNYDGSLVGARGDLAYFFDTGLRLLGQGNIPTPQTSKGIAFHPLHANFRSNSNLSGTYNPNVHLAFVPTGNRTVDIIDTQRGGDPIGRVTIKDIINGPLKAILPFPEDNAGRACAATPVQDRNGVTIGEAVQIYEGTSFSDPIAENGITEDACVVVKLFGTSTSGGVVVIPVRKADILRHHPSRAN
jgi:predicted RNA-binding protein with TRAM domain